jgi:hypothetical protein
MKNVFLMKPRNSSMFNNEVINLYTEEVAGMFVHH